MTQQISPQDLVNQLEQSLSSSGDPTQMTRAQITSEIATLAGRRVVNGSLTDQERDRLTTLVAAQAGISKEEAARRVARMEQDAVAALAQTEQQARKAAAAAAHGAAAGAKALFSGLLLSLAGAMVGAWMGTRHARLLTPIHEHEYDTHTTTTVTHHAYEPVAATHYTAYEPVAAAPTSVRVHDETDQRGTVLPPRGLVPGDQTGSAAARKGEQRRARGSAQARAGRRSQLQQPTRLDVRALCSLTKKKGRDQHAGTPFGGPACRPANRDWAVTLCHARSRESEPYPPACGQRPDL